MIAFYILALIPAVIGGVLFLKSNKIVWQEWLLGSIAAMICAGSIHIIAYNAAVHDVQTLSGYIDKVSHYPAWTERYTKHHSETYYTGSGKDRTSHTRHWTTTEYDYHREHYKAFGDYGSFVEDFEISSEEYAEVKELFGNTVKRDGKQSNNHLGGTKSSGDNNIYSVFNETMYKLPTTTHKSFVNKVKASPSLFSFSKVPSNITVFPYPENTNWRRSDRVLGIAEQYISARQWDCMNAYLGPLKKANVIIVGFTNSNPQYGRYQESAWIGGKKNDLVLCFGIGESNKVNWSYVFGWTEKEIVKKNLQSILLTERLSDDIIPLLTQEITKNYIIKDWSKFSYITIDTPKWAYPVFFFVLVTSQVVLYIFFHRNDSSKSKFGNYSVRRNFGRGR